MPPVVRFPTLTIGTDARRMDRSPRSNEAFRRLVPQRYPSDNSDNPPRARVATAPGVCPLMSCRNFCSLKAKDRSVLTSCHRTVEDYDRLLRVTFAIPC